MSTKQVALRFSQPQPRFLTRFRLPISGDLWSQTDVDKVAVANFQRPSAP